MHDLCVWLPVSVWVCSFSSCFAPFFDGLSVVDVRGCLLEVASSRVKMCDVLWVLGDGDVILVVCALVLVTLESNSEGKIRISERFNTFINTETKTLKVLHRRAFLQNFSCSISWGMWRNNVPSAWYIVGMKTKPEQKTEEKLQKLKSNIYNSHHGSEFKMNIYCIKVIT